MSDFRPHAPHAARFARLCAPLLIFTALAAFLCSCQQPSETPWGFTSRLLCATPAALLPSGSPLVRGEMASNPAQTPQIYARLFFSHPLEFWLAESGTPQHGTDFITASPAFSLPDANLALACLPENFPPTLASTGYKNSYFALSPPCLA